MIEVQNLTKRYGRVTAVDDVSFRVERGEIFGFLGPNGAGKTTTMRILTGYMPATDGKAVVAGFDIFDQPVEAKRRIGYLPETPPLYPDMTVAEYLSFVAKIKGVPSGDRKVRIKQVRSGIGHSWRMRLTLEALGLRNHQAEVIKQDSPALRGQIKHVRHLVEVTPVED